MFLFLEIKIKNLVTYRTAFHSKQNKPAYLIVKKLVKFFVSICYCISPPPLPVKIVLRDPPPQMYSDSLPTILTHSTPLKLCKLTIILVDIKKISRRYQKEPICCTLIGYVFPLIYIINMLSPFMFV